MWRTVSYLQKRARFSLFEGHRTRNGVTHTSPKCPWYAVHTHDWISMSGWMSMFRWILLFLVTERWMDMSGKDILTNYVCITLDTSTRRHVPVVMHRCHLVGRTGVPALCKGGSGRYDSRKILELRFSVLVLRSSPKLGFWILTRILNISLRCFKWKCFCL